MSDITRRRGVDRLSALPDEILGEIIGRLNNIVTAVRTSILSKRWRNLWTSIPIVSFTWPRFFISSSDHRRFINLATAVLQRRRGAAIRRLCFDMGHHDDDYDKDIPWLLYRALQFNVEELVITKISYLPNYPSGFSNLTSLELNDVTLPHSDFGEQLRNSPELHTLSLTRCQFREIKISNASLKKLTMHWCAAENALLCAPGILSLDLDVNCIYFDNFNVRDLPSLSSASLSIRRCSNIDMLREILGVLEFAHRAELLAFELEMKYRDLLLDLPKFCNLEHLAIGEQLNSKVKYCLTKSVLFNAPKLESLVLVNGNRALVRSSRNSYAPLAHLKRVQFLGFVGDGNFVFELLKIVSRQAAGSKMVTFLSLDD